VKLGCHGILYDVSIPINLIASLCDLPYMSYQLININNHYTVEIKLVSYGLLKVAIVANACA